MWAKERAQRPPVHTRTHARTHTHTQSPGVLPRSAACPKARAHTNSRNPPKAAARLCLSPPPGAGMVFVASRAGDEGEERMVRRKRSKDRKRWWRMRKMELKRMRKRILRMWMKRKVAMRMTKETRMGKSRMVMQKNDLQRRKRMKWIQRDRRQRMGLQLESSPSISSVPSISPPPFQPVLALSISLWLHTISDEERLEMLSSREDSSFLPTRRSQPIYDIPHLELFQSPTSSCAPLKNEPLPSRISLFPIVTQCITLPGPYARLFTWQAPTIPFHLPSLFFTSMSEILGSFCSRDLLSDILPESRRLQAQISWCIFQS
ncbi:uncharacterized protein LOC126913369 [Cygnus atratus]|uniref:uncharacterized protein LOC126913369 n=1 Tax=Cygnus atratus TaxID=8868 RepID=UPI0021B7049B|nr:uncharacterized protein LOC126913369 [Cygnus atratus]